MLGWSITVRIAPLKGAKLGPESILARWMTDASGLAWLHPLLDQGRVLQTKKNGYPNEYRGLAGDILPLLQTDAMQPRGLGAWVFGLDEGEEYAIPPGGMVADAVRYDDRIAACRDDQWLTIEAWDQS
ncbi:hypothetical protein ACQKIE_07305 [Luteibacter sp. NPDC031894]|uniref:hypothetical protein n=1 Tax=Luteibacter sp. NPDC031894 TaxID=3390572 RepID=UPI003D063736